MITEILAVIDAGPGKFYAGIVLWDDIVVEAADIVGYMKRQRWTRDRVRSYCATRGWKVSVVRQIRREKYA